MNANVEVRVHLKKPRITPHQKRVLTSLMYWSRKNPSKDGFVDGKFLGAPAALEHLFKKGYAERSLVVGPRGGHRYEYRPVGWRS